MTFTPTGFDGTIDESSLARMLALAGGGAVVNSRSDFAISQVANTRAVRVSAGSAYASGVLVESNASETVNVIGPSAGQWSMVVLRRNHDTDTVTVVSLEHSTTSIAQPIAPPTGTPSGFENRPGLVSDHPLYWVWSVTGQTAVLWIDLRRLPAGIPLRGTTAEKLTYYGTPTWRAAQRHLQGSTWFNTDQNLHEVYQAPYDATTNPGGVQALGAAATAGWYFVGQNGALSVVDGRWSDTQPIPGGVTAIIARQVFTLSQGRLLTFEHWIRWFAPGNAAMTWQQKINGILLPDRHRLHTEGGDERLVTDTLQNTVWVPAGTHTYTAEIDAESKAIGTRKQDSILRAYGQRN